MGLGPLSQRNHAQVLGIVVALPVECRSLSRRRVRIGQLLPLAPGILVQVAGMGAPRALAAAEALLNAGARAILNWGGAAALKPGLAAGTLLLPKHFSLPEGTKTGADPNWWANLYQVLAGSLPIITTPLVSSDRVLATPADKQALYEASCAAAADMESAFLARWAAQRRLPFAALRAISDTAATTIPAPVLAAADEQGKVSLPRLLGRLLSDPGQLRALINLGRQFHAAHIHLTQAADLLYAHRFGLP